MKGFSREYIPVAGCHSYWWSMLVSRESGNKRNRWFLGIIFPYSLLL